MEYVVIAPILRVIVLGTAAPEIRFDDAALTRFKRA
jgi:hypothetical protein